MPKETVLKMVYTTWASARHNPYIENHSICSQYFKKLQLLSEGKCTVKGKILPGQCVVNHHRKFFNAHWTTGRIPYMEMVGCHFSTCIFFLGPPIVISCANLGQLAFPHIECLPAPGGWLQQDCVQQSLVIECILTFICL